MRRSFLGSRVLLFPVNPALIQLTLNLTSHTDPFSEEIYLTSTRFMALSRRRNTCRHRVLISDAKLICGEQGTTLIKHNRYRCIQKRLLKRGRVREDSRSNGEACSPCISL